MSTAAPLEPVRPVGIARSGTVPVVALLQMITGYWTTQLISVAARLRLADLVSDGPRSAADIAAAAGADASVLYRVLRALSSLGVFFEHDDGAFELTEVGTFLRSDVPGSLQPMAAMNGEEWHWRPWGALLDAVQSGHTAFGDLFGTDVYGYLRAHDDQRKTFEAAMTGFSTQSHLLALSAYDAGDVRKVVDVGGGYGTLLAAVLAQNPRASGTLLEQPRVVEDAREHIRAAGLEDRCEAVAGDFFESVPRGADLYMLSMVISDWEDEPARTILSNCARAMDPDGRLILLQMVIDDRNSPSFAAELDIYCLVMAGGRERTAEEYEALLAAAGLRLERIHPSLSPVRVIEARRA
jgi:SAM-dependent methyltransferase